MKSVNLEMPDQLAIVIDGLSKKGKTSVALLAALIAQTEPKQLETIFERADKKVALSGLTEIEIDHLREEIS